VNDAMHRVLVPHVGHDRVRLASGGSDLGDDLFEGFSPPGDENDAGSVLGKCSPQSPS
jgi:hypothetical protein